MNERTSDSSALLNRFRGGADALLRFVAGLLLFEPGALKLLGW